MGVTKKPSGVNIIGLGAADLNEFKPVDQLKDLYIQLTADGATDESMDYLAYLKSYAEHNQSIGLPIMPNGVNVWISNNGKTSAVEADDLSLEGGVYTICGITCTDGEWDFTNAGQHSGGGGSGLPEVDDSDNGKVLTVVDGEWAAASGGGGGGGLLVHANFPQFVEEPATLDKNWNEINAVVQSGVMPVFMGGDGGILICVEVFSEDDEYIVALIDLSNGGEPRGFAFISDSATGVLTYTPEP